LISKGWKLKIQLFDFDKSLALIRDLLYNNIVSKNYTKSRRFCGMQKHVELKVDVVNQLILYRNSTFKDKLCFLDEDIQNAQRARATEVRITRDTRNKRLTIENNGAVLEDVQKLFSMAESGWDEEIKDNENPFGLGFFSNISVSSLLEIHTGDTRVLFDVDKVIRTRDAGAIDVDKLDEPYEGFKLIMHNFDYSNVYSHQISERVELLGKYVHELDVYLDGTKQQQMDLTEGDGDPDNYKIEEEGLQGWIRLTDGWSGKLSVYYKGRFVVNLTDLRGVLGDLHVTDKVLNLTAPDRKDVIRDTKYNELIELIKLYLEELCISYIENKDSDEIDRMAESIEKYVSVDKIKDRIKFLVFNGKRDGKLLDKILTIKKDKYIQTFSSMEAYLNDESYIQPESHFDEIDCVKTVEGNAPHRSRSYGGSGNYYSGSTSPVINQKDVVETKGEEYFYGKGAKFWVGIHDVDEYEKKVDVIKHYNLDLIISRNKLEDKILGAMEAKNLIFHVSKIEDKMTITSNLSKTELSKKEQRALMLFEMVSRMCGFDRNIFAIGNLCVTRVFEIPELNIRDEQIVDEIVAIRNYDVDKIYVDRSIIKLSGLRNDLFPILTLEDYKFILRNVDELAEELSFMLERGVSAIREDLIHGLANA
jgi:hypothetical protein